MSIRLYKEGCTHKVRGVTCEARVFRAFSFQSCLDDGWVIDPNDLYKEEENVQEETSEEIKEIPTKEEADKTGLLSTKEVRAAAKKAGIKTWKTSRIATLKRELGYEQS